MHVFALQALQATTCKKKIQGVAKSQRWTKFLRLSFLSLRGMAIPSIGEVVGDWDKYANDVGGEEAMPEGGELRTPAAFASYHQWYWGFLVTLAAGGIVGIVGLDSDIFMRVLVLYCNLNVLNNQSKCSKCQGEC